MDPRTDLRIWHEVLDAFRRETQLDSSDISVEVRDGVVSLEGSVASFSETRLASLLASRISGVLQVSNHLRVIPSAPRGDPDIANDIRATLDHDERLDLPSRIQVNVEAGVVTLRGAVESFDERESVVEDTEKVAGVVDVQSDLQVIPDIIRRDAEIQNDVKRKLVEDIIVDANTIRISVQGGVVTLTGTVPSLFQKQAAEDDAWAQPGVRGVVNELRVWYESGP
jgi:osmotically-inducible protein OsmY